MSFSQIATSVTILNSGLIGYCGVSLTNFDSSALSAIAAGSSVEIAGAFFKADADVTINASSWTAITTATTAYLHLTPSGTAGSQIISAAWSSTIPVWSTSKQGWYSSAGSSVRVVAKSYKDGPTSQSGKIFLGSNQNQFDSYKMHGFTTVISTVGSSTFTVPTNTYRLKVFILGGGGGGAGAYTTVATILGGGGGGGTSIHNGDAILINVQPNEIINYTIGTGGSAGGLNANGGTGGASIFGSYTASGGSGGKAYSFSSSPLAGGAGAILKYGGAYGCSGEYETAVALGGNGGGATGGPGGNQYTPAISGLYGGGGGGGGGAVVSGASSGAAGGSGLIVVEY